MKPPNVTFVNSVANFTLSSFEVGTYKHSSTSICQFQFGGLRMGDVHPLSPLPDFTVLANGVDSVVRRVGVGVHMLNIGNMYQYFP